MNTTTSRLLVLAAACVVTACQTAPAGTAPTAAAPLVATVSHGPTAAAAVAPGAKSFRVKAAVRTGGTRQLMAAVREWNSGDIAKLVFSIALKDDPNVIIASDELTNAELGDELVFSNLKNDTWYRIQATAYRGDGFGSFAPISVNDQSKLDFQVLKDDELAIGTVPVQLEAVTFEGEATSGGVDILPGGFSHAPSETIGHGPKN